MRVVFAGSPEPAVAVLRRLIAAGHEVPLVVSQPDRPRGRGGRERPTPLAAEAERLGLPLVRPRTINDPEVVARLLETGAGALVVVAFGQIIREALLSAWPCLNVHFSLLPAYRGAAPVERALMDGVTETGVTIMQMDAGLDTGPLISMERIAVGADEDAGSLLGRLAEAGGDLLAAALDDLEAGRLRTTPQPEEGVSLAPKIGDDDLPLDFSRPARALADQVRALSPHIGATCTIDGQRFKVWRAAAREEPAPAPLADAGGRLLARTGAGSLQILELQPPGRGRMPADAFLRGWRGALELGAG